MRTKISYGEELKDFLIISSISPLFGLVKLFRAKNEKFVIAGSMLAMSFFGALFSYPEGSDGHTHYMRSIEHYTYMDIPEFFSESWDILLQRSKLGTTDLYIHFLSFISNSVLGIPKSLHFFAGLVLGYFVAKSLLLVLDKDLRRLTWQTGLGIFIIILLIHSVFSLNAIRISTGAWVLFFGACSFYFTRNVKFLLLILVATQIHLAYVIIAIPVIVAFFLNRVKWVVIGIWSFSFFFQLDFVDVSTYVPKTEIVETKKQFYVLDETRLADFKEKRESQAGNWYAVMGPRIYFETALIIAILGSLLIYFNSADKNFDFLISSSLLFFALANIVSFSPSLQGRLMNCVSVFLLLGLLYHFQSFRSNTSERIKYKIFKLYIFLFSILSIPYLIKNASHVLNTTELFFVAVPILSFFSEENYSLRDLIGNIL